MTRRVRAGDPSPKELNDETDTLGCKGEWVEAEQHWSGFFTQVGKMPLTLRRGLPPARPVVEGLDGLWQGTVAANGLGCDENCVFSGEADRSPRCPSSPAHDRTRFRGRRGRRRSP